jgi:hypothetical protein
MDRLRISGNVPAELAEVQSDVAGDITDADEQEAIQSIIDDYLLLGDMYPPKGGREVVTAGMVAMEYMDEEDIENALSALTYGCGDFLDSRQRYVETLVRDNAEKYLRAKHPNLIERMIEELRPDGDES